MGWHSLADLTSSAQRPLCRRLQNIDLVVRPSLDECCRVLGLSWEFRSFCEGHPGLRACCPDISKGREFRQSVERSGAQREDLRKIGGFSPDPCGAVPAESAALRPPVWHRDLENFRLGLQYLGVFAFYDHGKAESRPGLPLTIRAMAGVEGQRLSGVAVANAAA